jgi:predicted permease
MVDFQTPSPSNAERLYRLLLHLYPADFRRAFQRELVEAFRDQRRAARRDGVRGTAFWPVILQDLLTQALSERATATWRATWLAAPFDPDRSLVSGVLLALRLTALRLAIRRLMRSPNFTVTTVVVLALGIGATTGVFSVVNGVLLRPLAYARADRLVALGHTVDVSGKTRVDESDASILLYQEHARAFSGVGAYRDRDANLGAVQGDPTPAVRVSIASVTANLFDVLQVQPSLGRTFEPGEDRVGAAPVAVISDQLWRSRFRGRVSAIGKRIVVDGESREVIGVMPPGFAYPHSSSVLWIPIAFDAAHANAASFGYLGVARLGDGVTIERAREDLERLIPQTLVEFPSGIPPAMWAHANVHATVMSLRDSITGGVSRVLWILLGSMCLVLVIACANVAGLFLVRGDSRQDEFAVRSALGSGNAEIVAQCLSEAFILAAASGFVGVTMTIPTVSLARRFGSSLSVPRLDQVDVDGRVMLFALAITVLCAVLISVVPVLRVRLVPIAEVLRRAGRGSSSGEGIKHFARSTLVVAQIALALVLVSASGLLGRSFARMRQVEPGFDVNGIDVSRLVIPNASYPTAASAIQLYSRLLEHVRALPGVSDASITNWVPLTDDHQDNIIGIEDHPMQPGAVPRVHVLANVEGRYFGTMGIPFLAGRTFSALDPRRPATEVVVSKAFAERYWPNSSPLGKRVRQGIAGRWFTIIGEVGNVHFDALTEPVNDALYFPLATQDTDRVTVPCYVALVVRHTSALDDISAIRAAVHAVDSSMPTYDDRSMASVVSAASARARVMLVLLAAASALAIILGTVGTYGAMAYRVSLRRQEIGVRVALGARPADVRRMISRNGVTLGIAGVATGLLCAVVVTRLVRTLLYDVSPTDAPTLCAASLVILAATFFSSWIPARHAASISPADALRNR